MMPFSTASCCVAVTLPTLSPTPARMFVASTTVVPTTSGTSTKSPPPPPPPPPATEGKIADGKALALLPPPPPLPLPPLGIAGAVDDVVAVAPAAGTTSVAWAGSLIATRTRISRSRPRNAADASCGSEGTPPTSTVVCWPAGHVDAVGEHGRELGFAGATERERLIGGQELVALTLGPNGQDAAAPVALIHRDHRPGVAGLEALEDLAEIGAGQRLGRRAAGARPRNAGVEVIKFGRQGFEARRRHRLELCGSAARNRSVASSNAFATAAGKGAPLLLFSCAAM